MATKKKLLPKKAAMKIIKKELTLAEVKIVSQILHETRKVASENHEIASYLEGDKKIFQFLDIDTESTFTFEATETFLQGRDKKVLFDVMYEPKNSHDLSVCFCKVDMEECLKRLHTWITILSDYARYDLSQEEQIDAKAEKEIYELFDFVDGDAETSSFDLKQQLYLDDALANVETALEAKKNEYEVSELIEEVKELRKIIPNETKKTFGRKFSRFLVKTKKKGISLFKELVKDFFKDLIKKGIEGGFHRMIENFQ